MTHKSWLEGLFETISNASSRMQDKNCDLETALSALESMLLDLRTHDAALWWVGNGGSAAICSHLSQDVLNKLNIRSQTLNDPALQTCMANDYGFEEVFSRPLSLLARPGDMLIAISSSGNSQNIINAAKFAGENGMTLATLSAFEGDNPLWSLKANLSFHLSTSLYGHAELGHEALLHSVLECMYLKQKQN